MRTLNTNVSKNKKFSKFSLPGFRSGSIVKKFFALLYYCFVVTKMISMTTSYLEGDFSGVGDVLVFILIDLLMLGVFITPVVAIGLSDYYDWHGIKLFMIIMIPICIFSSVAIYSVSLFSKQYTDSMFPQQIEMQTDSDADSALESDASQIVNSLE